MKTFVKIISLTMLALLPIMAIAKNTLNHTSCSHDSDRQNQVKPINKISFSFDEIVELTENVSANITCDGEEVANPVDFETTYHGFDYVGAPIYAFFIMNFDNLLLPKGREYEIRVAAGSIYSEKDPTKLNGDIVVKYSIPEDLGSAGFMDVYTTSRVDKITCWWKYEIKTVEDSEWELYREDMLIGKYPVKTTFDTDYGAGFAHCVFNGGMLFDKDVTYRLVLPAGSVSAERTDIVNKREEIVFVGGVATTSVEDIESDSTPAVRCTDRTITVSGLNGTERVRVVSADGKIIRDTAAGSGNLNITLSAPGLHIVTVDDTAHKVLAR